MFHLLTRGGRRVGEDLAALALLWRRPRRLRNSCGKKDLVKMALRSRVGQDLLMLLEGIAAVVEHHPLLNVLDE